MAERPTLFVELCARTAAVSLALEGDRKPPISGPGCKAGYTGAILSAMGLRPGQGADRYLWVEPEEGIASILHCYDQLRLVGSAIEGWGDRAPRDLWDRLRAESKPRGSPAHEAAKQIILYRWSFSARGPRHGYGGPGCVVNAPAANWTTEQRDRALSCGRTAEKCRAAGMCWSPSPEVVCGFAQDVDPRVHVKGHTVVYMDPDYQGTTGYQHSFPRAEVIETAQRWRAEGALVVISEAEPLEIEGWHHIEITRSRRGNARTFSKQRREWLTMSEPPRVQQRLFPLKEATP